MKNVDKFDVLVAMSMALIATTAIVVLGTAVGRASNRVAALEPLAARLETHCRFEAIQLESIARFVAEDPAHSHGLVFVGAEMFRELETSDFHELRLCEPDYAPRIYCDVTDRSDHTCMRTSVAMARAYLGAP